jgi:hypothetical protein
MDILKVLKNLRTERPVGIVTNNGERLCEFQLETIEVLLGEGHDSVEIRGTVIGLDDKSGKLGDIIATFEDETFTGLAIANVDVNNKVNNVDQAYKMRRGRTNGTYLVAQYFDITDGVKSGLTGAVYNFKPIETINDTDDGVEA